MFRVKRRRTQMVCEGQRVNPVGMHASTQAWTRLGSDWMNIVAFTVAPRHVCKIAGSDYERRAQLANDIMSVN